MNVNTYLHKYLKEYLTKEMVVADMTMGNGNDTLFLALNTSHVFAFDIQRDAIKNTENRLNGLSNYSLILDNHLNFDDYLDEDEISLFVFNLGYLPNGNQNIITEANNTLNTFIKAYDYLKENGLICITFYFHEGGKKEYGLLTQYIKDNNLNVIKTYKEDKVNAPVLYVIKKVTK